MRFRGKEFEEEEYAEAVKGDTGGRLRPDGSPKGDRAWEGPLAGGLVSGQRQGRGGLGGAAERWRHTCMAVRVPKLQPRPPPPRTGQP